MTPADLNERERQFQTVLMGMEARGVRLDVKRTEEIRDFYLGIMERADKDIHKYSPGMNPNSPQQLQAEFFGKQGLQPLTYCRKGKTRIYTDCKFCKGGGCRVCQGTGRNPKCDGEFLASIGTKVDPETGDIKPNNPLAHAILLHKAAGTMHGFVKQYLQLKVRDEAGAWIIHPNYRQAKVVTGRLSCANPNLQNVASDESGKKKVDMPFRPRECFIPRAGKTFLVPDYAQIEIWILAVLAKANRLLDRLARGGDAHQVVADLVWPNAYDRTAVKASKKIPPEKWTDAMKKAVKTAKRIRKIAKNLNFGKVYGAGIDQVAHLMGCTVEEATGFMLEYNRAFPEVEQFMETTIAKVKRHGSAVNPYGRIFHIHRGLEYRITNYLVQGTAADVIKEGMLAIDRASLPVDMLMQIHDELLIEADDDLVGPSLFQEVATAMGSAHKFLGCPVPFPVSMKVSKERWSMAEEVAA